MIDELAELMQRMEQEHRDLLDRLRDRIAAETLADFLWWLWLRRAEIGIPPYIPGSYTQPTIPMDVLRLSDQYAHVIENGIDHYGETAMPIPRFEDLKPFLGDLFLRAFAKERERLQRKAEELTPEPPKRRGMA